MSKNWTQPFTLPSLLLARGKGKVGPFDVAVIIDGRRVVSGSLRVKQALAAARELNDKDKTNSDRYAVANIDATLLDEIDRGVYKISGVK